MFPQGAPYWVDVLDLLWTPGMWVFVSALVLTLLGTPLFRWIAVRSHLYNQLVDRLGLSVPVTVGLFFAMSVLFGAAGLLMLYIPGRIAILIYLAIAAIFMLIVWRLGFLHLTHEEKAAADRFLDSHRNVFARRKDP